MSRGSVWILLALCLLVAGCTESTRWTAVVTDVEHKPIPGAELLIWEYGLSEDRPFKQAEEIGAAFDGGATLMGWGFTADGKGEVVCKGFPTGGVVYDWKQGETITSRTASTAEATVSGSLGDVITGRASGQSTTRTTIPGQLTSKYEEGRWLAVTVRARGYKSRHFAFRPNAERGNLGVIRLERE